MLSCLSSHFILSYVSAEMQTRVEKVEKQSLCLPSTNFQKFSMPLLLKIFAAHRTFDRAFAFCSFRFLHLSSAFFSLACFHVFVEFPCRFSRDFELFWGVWLRHENFVVYTSVLLKLFALELSCNMCSNCTRVCVCVRVCSNSKSASAATFFFRFLAHVASVVVK